MAVRNTRFITFILVGIINLYVHSYSFSQNPLFIPPVLTGTDFDLTVQTGTQQFFPGNPTPTYGINGAFLSPTIVVNKGDIVTLNVHNTLNVSTTMHWHGLHVSAENDGGPHQLIAAGATWSPSFEILNNAGTFWYHPHGEGKTELHVSKGLAGLFIIHDPEEEALGLPSDYGVDDIPLIVQSKAFDVLQQIAIADHMDTSVFVNGTLHATTTVPAQVVRFRLLNGSSMRSFNFGFSNDLTFYQIATDGGLTAVPNAVTRLLLAPGERSEILVDFSSMNGQNLQLMSYASEMPDGIFGGPSVGIAPDTIHEYSMNFLNGSDFELLNLTIGAPTANPVTAIPSSLVSFTPYNTADMDVARTLVFDTLRLLPTNTPSLAEGPFGINNATFDMDSINIEIPLNSTEIWTLVNRTHIAHPFHIHDIQFNVIEKGGITPPITEQGWKDVILVMPHDSVKFITKFITFSDTMVPYMYHCHLLHHEDDGMMGSFLVIDPFAGLKESATSTIQVYPNPGTAYWNLEANWNNRPTEIRILNQLGQVVFRSEEHPQGSVLTIPNGKLSAGVYLISVQHPDFQEIIRVEKR